MIEQAKITVPQSNSFKTQHQLLRELTFPKKSLRSSDLNARQRDYALHSLRLLGFVDDENHVTEWGRKLGSRRELDSVSWEIIATSVSKSRTLQLLAPGLGTPAFQLSHEQLVDRIADLAGYSHSTSERRAQTLLSWHRQLIQTNLPLESRKQSEPSAMDIQYIRKIGEGAHGEVWHAKDQLGRELAVKFLHDDMQGAHDLLLDARALCRLTHENVVRVISVDNIRPPLKSTLPRKETTAVIMEFVPGRKLGDILAEGPLEGENVARIGICLIRAFKALHGVGVVHEDLHAGNIIVSDTTVKVIDPYYQKSMRSDALDSQRRRLDSDIRALKVVLSDLVTRSAIGQLEWGRVQSAFWKCESLPSVEECFTSYLLSVRPRDDNRPERGESPIPQPGGAAVSSYTRFIQELGFEEDPFFHTNAANEPLLSRYFIQPPYFRSLQADERRPSSGVVFAPRGSGKTAQALMLSEHARSVGILPLLYDHFPGLDKIAGQPPSLDYHVLNVARIGITALLLYMCSQKIKFSVLGDLHMAAGNLCHRLTRSITGPDVKRLQANPFLRDGLGDLWAEQLASASSPGEFLVQHCQEQGLGLKPSSGDLSASNALAIVKAVAQRLLFKGISVIVDRVDEAPWSANSAERTYRLVHPMLAELSLFDDPYVGWKVFLWDQCKGQLRDRARTDRLPVYDLSWTQDDLRTMLTSRLQAFSGNRISDLTQISEASSALAADVWPFIFAHYSPRSLIRILQYTISEQIETGEESPHISRRALEGGIRQFCNLSAQENTDRKHLRLLRRIGRATFTISHVAGVLREERESSRSKVTAMAAAGAVRQLGTIKVSSGVKSSNYYMIQEPAVIVWACPGSSVSEIMAEKCRICSGCPEVLFTENEDREDALACPECGSTDFVEP
ncbi:P-loop ATPase, Sll1717 family [Nannocystis pusilla]|uniref:P-loop ATPase, Sll1717 family n=1 Tax=Nannocystis pusilla TaxID=889268 RepID=UPI003BF35036